MRLSEYFLPTLREVPAEAQIVSHRLMLRAGLVRRTSSGIYAWLPLGLRVLRRVEAIVRDEQNRAGAIEMLMPTIQSADLWRQSGRYEDYGQEMLRIRDRHGHDMLYGPTNEEMITDIFREFVRSYRELPRILYHIQWKFRDEVRPRFGVMRGREFLMKDAYSFDINEESGRISYEKMLVAYLRSFTRMGLRSIPMRAETGPIGGTLSHEFVILAQTGESRIWCDRAVLDYDVLEEELNDPALRARAIEKWMTAYAATDDQHDPEEFAARVPKERRMESRGIEVGHIFFFGTKYSRKLGGIVQDKDGRDQFVHMGSYGIGVSRLVGAIIEACHDEAGIIWPDQVAPFDIGLINIRSDDEGSRQEANEIEARLEESGYQTLHDDRPERAGAKFADMDLIGLPWRVVVSPRLHKDGKVEIRRRATGITNIIPRDTLPDYLKNPDSHTGNGGG